MLYRLEIENFYSVRHRQVLDLRVADNVPDAAGRLDPIFPSSRERASRIIAIFGPNASGKTTILKALGFLAWFIRGSFHRAPNTGLPCERFNSADAANDRIRLAIEFGGRTHPTRDALEPEQAYGTWRYEVAMQPGAGSLPVVVSEALRIKPSGKTKWSRVFERSGTDVKASSAFGIPSGLARALPHTLRNNASLTSTLAQYNHDMSLHFAQAAARVFGNIDVDRIEFSDREVHEFYAQHGGVLDALNRDIQRIDLGIRQMVIEPRNNGPVAMFEHEGLEHKMPMFMESHGTRSFIKFYPLICRALETGGLAMIDEIDVAIHPLVLPEIIRWFRDSERNPHAAQLWMTCHAVSLLEELSKEEVFLCEKDSGGRTSIYGLQDIKDVRRDHNRYKKYLSGAYGAVPSIG